MAAGTTPRKRAVEQLRLGQVLTMMAWGKCFEPEASSLPTAIVGGFAFAQSPRLVEPSGRLAGLLRFYIASRQAHEVRQGLHQRFNFLTSPNSSHRPTPA